MVLKSPFITWSEKRKMALGLCPNRKQGPCRPKMWSNEDLGFLDVIVLQCVFCSRQVIYQKSDVGGVVVENTDKSVMTH